MLRPGAPMIADNTRLFADLRLVPERERRFRALSLLAGALWVSYALATALGAPAALLTYVFNVPMLCIVPMAWWTYRRAPADSQPMWFLFSVAASLWPIGAIGWTLQFIDNGERVPAPPTPWDALFALAMLLTLYALVQALRDAVRLTDAALDTLVVVAPGIAVGTALVEHDLARGLSGASLLSLYRPLLAIAIL